MSYLSPYSNNFCKSSYFCCFLFFLAVCFQSFQQQFSHVQLFLLLPLLSSSLFSYLPATISACPAIIVAFTLPSWLISYLLATISAYLDIIVALTSYQPAYFSPSSNNFCMSGHYCCFLFFLAVCFQTFQQQFSHVQLFLLLPLLQSWLISYLLATISAYLDIIVAFTSSQISFFKYPHVNGKESNYLAFYISNV